MRATLIAICFLATSCGRNSDSEAGASSPPDEIEITGGALDALQNADGSAVEMIALEPREHIDKVGVIYDRLQSDATKEIAPPEGLAASEYITVRFPDGRSYYMITSSLLELNGKWYEGDFDYAMAGLISYVHSNADYGWNEKRLYSRYPSEAELEEIRVKRFAKLQEKTGGEQDAGDQTPAAVD